MSWLKGPPISYKGSVFSLMKVYCGTCGSFNRSHLLFQCAAKATRNYEINFWGKFDRMEVHRSILFDSTENRKFFLFSPRIKKPHVLGFFLPLPTFTHFIPFG